MIRTLALLAPLLWAGPALAQTIDLSQGGPVDITANDGIEWRQAEQVVVARGGARAERAGTAVDAARLLARYRPLPGAAPAAPGNEALGGSNEIWRLEAEGSVRISTATDVATGDRAVYDMDQSVLVLSGRNISLTTPQQAITARDSLEYWTQRRMAVARGNALVVTEDGRRITADVLVAYLLEDANNPQAAAARAAPRPGTQGAASPPPGQGRLDRVELFGNVEIRSAEEVVRGDRGVYSAETGQARLLGNVRITRGQNQINGQEALVNLNTGVSRLVGQPGQRVQGVVAPGTRESTLPGQGARP
ncbi:LptA/OstA family protein [Roseococcus thiosulfatophilus]|uniref:LptA/OstA family protein n=1 Tax=Roseococcus thiosulfatophilus TaxID=35813 RepID=UPI001A8FD66B|nr:LptA/OstA family protein [Roseococcus thiosulfatophilus]